MKFYDFCRRSQGTFGSKIQNLSLQWGNFLNSIEFERFIFNVSCFPLIRSQPSYTSGYINSNSYAGATSAYATDSYASGHGSYNDVGNNLGPSDSYTGVDSYKAPPSGKYPNSQFVHFSYKQRKMSIFF